MSYFQIPLEAWASAEIFPGGQCQHFVYPFQLADDAMQMHIHKMLHHKEKAPCYGGSHKNTFVGSSSQEWEWEGFFPEGANQSRISRPPSPSRGSRCHRGPKFSPVATGAFVGLAAQTKLQPQN